MSVIRATPRKVWPSAADAITLPSPASPGGYGDWVEVVASAAANSQVAGFMAGLKQVGSGGSLVEIQLGVGSVGNEVAFGSFLVVNAGAGNLAMETLELPVPVDKIALGDRVVARISQQPTTSDVDLAVLYYENLDTRTATTGVYTYAPFDTNDSHGTVTPSATAWQTSATWVELAAGLQVSSALIGVGVLPGGGQAGVEWELDLAVGAAGSERVITTVPSIISDALVQGFTNRWFPAPFPVGAHTRVSCKLRKSGTNTNPLTVRLLYLGGVDLLREEVTFVNDRTPGLTHTEITLSDNSVEAWSVIPMDDPLTYDYGRKQPRVLSWADIRRSSGDFYGTPVAADFKFTVRDKDLHVLGYLGTLAHTFTNRYTVTRSVSDADRRLQLTRRIIFRGPIRSVAPRAGATHEFTVKDYLQERFGPNSDVATLPRRKVLKEDFPACETDLVNSSAEQYVVDGAFDLTQMIDGNEVNTTVISIRGGVGTFSNDQVRFSSHDTPYAVTASSANDPETSFTINPALTHVLADGETITQTPTHRVTPGKGTVVPVRAGLITDRHVVGDIDSGDGQGKSIYVGDETHDDGFVYAMFVWACHGCFSPDGRPIQQLYFWNQAVDNLAGANLYENGALMGLTLGDLETEAGSGGRILIPGYDNWGDNGFSASYYDNAGRRYTRYGVRGVYRDWALGIRPAPQNLGGAPHAVNAYGMDSTLDGFGNEVSDIHDQFVLWFNNFGWGDYQGGQPLLDPTFPDDPTLTLLDLASIEAAKEHGATLVSGGFRGDWSMGVDNEQITMAEAIKRFVLSMGVEQSWNRKTQFFVDRMNTDQATAMDGAPTLTDERDVQKMSFVIDEAPTQLFTGLPFVHTKDELGRSTGGWRSSAADFNVASRADTYADTPAIVQRYSPSGTELLSQPLEFHFLRGKNRSTDADEYQQGSDTINAILQYKLTMSKVRIISFTTWGKGYDIEIFDRLWVQHFANVDAFTIFRVRRTPRPVRVIEHDAQPDKWRVALKCFDLGGLFTTDPGDPDHGPFDLPSTTITGSGGITIGPPSISGLNSTITGTGSITIGAPTIIAAGGLSGTLLLAWDANPPEDGVTGYLLEWGTASGVYTNTRDVGNVTTYLLTGLAAATTYYVSIEAYVDSSDPLTYSSDSTEVSGVAS